MINPPRLLQPRADGPCYQCKDRHVGCHAECQKYLSWKAERSKDWYERKTEFVNNMMVNDYICKNDMKIKKRKR